MSDRPDSSGEAGAQGWHWNTTSGSDWVPPSGPSSGHGWTPGPPPPRAPKPGIVPLRPLGFGEVLDGAFTLIQRYPAILLGFSAVVYAVVAALLYGWSSTIGVNASVAPLEQLNSMTPGEQTEAMYAFAASTAWLALGSGVLNWLAGALLTGVITVTAARGVLGEPATMRETWRAFSPRLPRLLGLTILVGLIIAAPFAAWALLVVLVSLTGSVVGTVAIAVLGAIGAGVLAIFLGVRLTLASAALVLETHAGSGPTHRRPIRIREALRRSWGLVGGRWWRTFGLVLVGVLIAAVVSGILEYAVTLLGGLFSNILGGSNGAGTAIATGVGFISSGILQMAVISAVSVLIYVDARMRTEGLDIVLGGGLPQPGDSPGAGTSLAAPDADITTGRAAEDPWSVP